ncbi:MAG: sulfatase-like hydrolase/transferase [Deltaproteobacteria bacterium]|nr:sulfatase-like hydrolase/transferase [Deltaproteobacteria bacterium]
MTPLPTVSSAGGSRRARARWARRLAALVLLLPTLVVVAVDLALRGSRIVAFPAKYLGSYAAAVLEGAALWTLLLAVASGRRGLGRWLGALLFVGLATAAVGGQIYFYRQYSTYLNLDATLFATSMADSVVDQIDADRRNFLAAMVPTALAATGLVILGRRFVRSRRRTVRYGGLVAPLALLGVLSLPCSYRAIQGSTPDVLYFHAIGGALQNMTGIKKTPDVRPKRRTPPPLPRLTATPRRPRNVLFILTESVRADMGCPAFREPCPTMPFSNRAAPQRLPLAELRANATTTAIELAVLWSGLEPNAGREPLHAAPVLFDFAHAAGLGTAYWTSHHMMFANSRHWVQDLPLDHHCHATTLDPLADIDNGASDALLADRILAELPGLKEPFFAVAHFGNTHVPYKIDPTDAPFQPALASKAEADNAAYKNYYANAVHLQDRSVARVIEGLRASRFGADTVIVYTSDHGEQFREHGQLGHTASVFDVELHVPGWVDAPAGTLALEERAALAGYGTKPTFHTDVTPTMLDLLGLWDAPEVAPFRARMVGGSLLRPDRPLATLALTNCSGVWGCAFENWGVMQGFRKVHAREWDQDWLCHDVAADPEELRALPATDEPCAELANHALALFGALPGRGAR